ncbi:KAP family NTPase [Geothermobacter hydrogeniphilus]|nr:KAP family NTPase [Geothermobacter hydrogeniphilus]
MCDKQNRVTFETRDEYQRKPIAEKIIRLLESDAKVSPLVIDGSWGSGKTEFCKKLIHLIEDGESSLRPIYVDAFKADHADEPLMTLMAAVLNALPEAEREPLIKKALPAIKFGVKTALKAGTSWLLKQDAADVVEDFKDEVKKAGDELINHAVESVLKDHVDAEQNITTLQAALFELAKDAPIVLFIDELDRCRPDFAVNMLENIKHIFDVEGVQFVLITNFDQLRSSINHCYGTGLEDAQRYLDKFVQFSLSLSDTHKPDGHESVLASVTHLKDLVGNSELLDNTDLEKEGGGYFLASLVAANRLSLREVETLVLHLEIYQSLTDKKGMQTRKDFGYCLLRVLGVFLYCFKPEIAESMRRNALATSDIAAVIGKAELFSKLDEEYPDHGDTVLAMISAEVPSQNGTFFLSEEEKKRWAETFSDYFRGAYGGRSGRFTDIVVEAIETMKLAR